MGSRKLSIHTVEGEFEGTYLTVWYYRGGCAVHCEYQPCYGCLDGNGSRFYPAAVGILESVNYRTNICPLKQL
jgi:hypothetical protein